MPFAQTNLPPLPLNGGCQCGQVRYAIHAMPILFYLCHCSACQTQTSSAFGESLRCDPATVTVSGMMRTTRRIAESGTVRLGDFCPDCGVRIQHRSEGDPGRLNIKAGTLDDASWLMPAGHVWTRSKQAFVTIPDDELRYLEGPDDGAAAMTARWRAMLGLDP
ncbi:GFA family protein [Jiella sp. MQZ9-1]|uniref:GFA family protein n=1 Tax=Jiella flava TaxID=2816857 RepID=A0A939G188_9HYPH|nr:GFA family protein [Jiella flava]MBO0664501.1 GFA family protein [Jiella flava]MCD2473137.1 GFA family protein [Jiella flava]